MNLNEDPAQQIVDQAFHRLHDPARVTLERTWFRNILYYIGEQWIEYLQKAGVFQKRYRSQPYIPTPVSNIVRDYVRSMKALVLNKEYTPKVWPNSEELLDKEAADLGTLYLQWSDSKDDEAFLTEQEKTIVWILLTGMGFMRTFPDMEKGQWGLDNAGKLKQGEEVTRNIIVFNMALDTLGESLRDKRYVGMQSLQSREWIEDTFKMKVNADGATDPSVSYQRKLMQIVSAVSPWKGVSFDTAASVPLTDDLVLMRELELKPTKKYPEGRYIISAGGQIIKEYDRMPIPITDGKWEYSFTDFSYNYVPGRYWADPGVNDIISPQNTINEIDQCLAMNRKGLGRPMVVTTPGMNLVKKTSYGQSILAIEYDNLTSGGNAPRVYNGRPLPNQVLDERTINQAVAQDAAGDPKHVLRGQAPSGNASGYLVDILRETAELGHAPDIKRIFRGFKSVYRKRLIVAKEITTQKKMLKIAGAGNTVQIKAFKGSDLRDNTDVRLEFTSGISTTNAGRTQTIVRLQESGFFGDPSQDPEMQQDLLSRLGLNNLSYGKNEDVQRAKRENAQVMQKDIDNIMAVDAPVGPDGQPDMSAEPEILNDDVLFEFDDHSVHIEIHRKFIISPEFSAMDERLRTVMIYHMKAHQHAMQVMMQNAQAQQIADAKRQKDVLEPPKPAEKEQPPAERTPDQIAEEAYRARQGGAEQGMV